jgi:hypothetical protein
MSFEKAENNFLPALDPDRADEALRAVDEVVRLYINGIRKVERRILSVPDKVGMGPQENVAEHSHSLWLAIKTLWENSSALGIEFGKDFDIGLALTAAQVHDIGESKSKNGDVDAMSEDALVIDSKQHDEITAFRAIDRTNQYLGWLADAGIEAEQKEKVEYKFNSDVDKHIGTRIIALYAPYRWWGAGGAITTREKHERIMREKLLTPFGHTLFDAIQRDFDQRENIFPLTTQHGEAFRTSFTHKVLMGHRIWPSQGLGKVE